METISFTLKTTTINTSTNLYDYYNRIIDNSQGIIKNSMCDITWKNVSLLNLLGELYYQYDLYNISLIGISHGIRAGTTAEQINVNYSIMMSGLNWLTSYDQSTKQNSNYINMANIKSNNGATVGDSLLLYDNSFFTFKKLNDITDINIKFILLSSDDYPSYNNVGKMVTHYIFQFVIHPIKPIIYHHLENKNNNPVHVVKYPF